MPRGISKGLTWPQSNSPGGHSDLELKKLKIRREVGEIDIKGVLEGALEITGKAREESFKRARQKRFQRQCLEYGITPEWFEADDGAAEEASWE